MRSHVLVLVLVLVLDGAEEGSGVEIGATGQTLVPIGPAEEALMTKRSVFDHEKLDVYRQSVEFARWVTELLDDGSLGGGKSNAVNHLEDSSRSILNNIAEGNGKRSLRDRCRFFDIARGSALECAASLDVLVARKQLDEDRAEGGKALLVRIVSMLVKLVDKLLGPEQFG